MAWVTFRAWLDRVAARELAKVADETNRRLRQEHGTRKGAL